MLPLLAAILMLPACAGKVYMGVPLTVGDPTLRSLAGRAAAGDKQAQLDLGIRYEEGRGIRRDVAKARRLYQLAASDSAGLLWIYTPPVGKGAQGRIMPLNVGPRIKGLKEAESRLAELDDD